MNKIRRRSKWRYKKIETKRRNVGGSEEEK
jgi:hypothetical protein